MNQYEAMFLFDPTFGSSFENCEAEVRRIMERAEAKVLFCRKWEERRLAYRVKGRKRGVYVLVYFKCAPGKIASIERDVKLSEPVLRILILRAEGVTPEMMERAVGWRGEEPAVDREEERAPTKEVSTKEVSTKEVSTEEVSTKEVSTEEVSTEEVSTEEVSTEDAPAVPEEAMQKDAGVDVEEDDLEDTAEMIVEPVEVQSAAEETPRKDTVSETDPPVRE